jgi:hypothetical protein
MADIFNLTDTWNSGGTTFQAIKMDVTDTASATASSLLQLLVGGVSRFDIRKNADVRINPGSSAATRIFADGQFRTGSIQIGFDAQGGSALAVGDGAGVTVFGTLGTNGFVMGSTRYIGFGSTGIVTPDARFHRTGAGIVRYSADGTAGATLEFAEQTAPAAPSTNFVRIYAEDNGSGKTRLMALFATGAAQQIAIEP